MARRPAISLTSALSDARDALSGVRHKSRLSAIVHSPDLVIETAEGDGRDAVIVFNSLNARMAGAAPAEFLGAASDHGKRPVVFVTDPTRRWFQGAGVAERIVDCVRAHLDQVGARAHLTLGTSMGGYGAAIFAKPLGAKAGLAIGAQYDVGPDAEEDKWLDERAAIDQHRLGPASGHIDGAARITTIHGRRDRWHSKNFAKIVGVKAWIGPIGPHNIAMPMKEAGILKPLVKAAFNLDDNAIAALLTKFGSRRKPVPPPYRHLHQAEVA